MNNNRIIQRSVQKRSLRLDDLSIRDTYAALEFYYYNNRLYTLLQQDLFEHSIWVEGMLPLRNPAHRVVEFYVAKLWPGTLPDALPIVTSGQKQALTDAIQQVWKWSNWGRKKQVAARWFAIYGDMFIKVVGKADEDGQGGRVYFRNIKPEYVTEMREDDRDYLEYIRIDVPQKKKVGQNMVDYYHTEVWDKRLQLYRRWENEKGFDVETERLGQPAEEIGFSEFGIDFIPIVHAKFQDTGEERGIGAYVHVLDKIDEANRMATRLHQLLYNYNDVTFAVSANDKDPLGRPMPAPRLVLDGEEQKDNGITSIGRGMKVARLPGMSTLQSLVPDLKYDAALKILQDQMLELERDLPEMAYSRVREYGMELSGRAIRLLLTDAIDKLLEARGNAEAALIQADEMAMTIGQKLGLFKGLGSYEAGDFEHSFAARPVIDLDELEKAQTIKTKVEATIPLRTAARQQGWTEDQITQMDEDRRKDKVAEKANLGQSLLEALRSFDQGNDGADE